MSDAIATIIEERNHDETWQACDDLKETPEDLENAFRS